MPHDTALIATIVAAFGFAFLLGLVAVRLRLPPLVGYLVAGVVVGPFTPGISADAALAGQLAELGVILLMFGVGLHFSLRDLAAVRRVVVPGAAGQALLTGTLGTLIGLAWGLGGGGAVVVGLSLSVASTVVLLKGLEGRDRLDSPEGRVAVGWLVVEDLMMVFALVLLPALAPLLSGERSTDSAAALALPVLTALAKVTVFLLLMAFVGRRLVPWILERVAKLGSREMFTLCVLVLALGVGSIAAHFFGVSIALGAFFAGAVISESELSHRAAADALPMQDAFAVLFFVSVGMLFDPAVVVDHPLRVVLLAAVVVLWKSAVAFGLVRLLKQPPRTALLIGASLGQIGEFSFIVAGLGVALGLIPREVQALIVATALIAITLNGPVLTAAVRIAQRITSSAGLHAVGASARMTREMRAAGRPTVILAEAEADARDELAADPYDFSLLDGHVVLVGYGRVGNTIAEALARAGARHVVVEEQERIVGGLRARGEMAIQGDATRADVLERAGIAGARLLVVTAPEPIRACRIVEVARQANPRLAVAVRTHSAAEQEFFERTLETPLAPGRAVYAEREAALSLTHYALMLLGRSDDEADGLVDTLRRQPTRPTEMFTVIADRG